MRDTVKQPAKEDGPQQKTPKGYEMPIPSRETVLSFFKKVARPKKS